MQRTYLSDTNADYKCLEDYLSNGEFGELPDKDSHTLQHDSLNNATILEFVRQMNPKFVSLDSNNEVLNGIDDLLDAHILPTRYDAPTSFHLLDSLVTTLRTTLERLDIETENFPLHATVPTGMINAMVVDLPCSSKSFLLFDSQLFTFCNLIAKIYAQCLFPVAGTYVVSTDTIKQTIANDPAIVIRLTGLLDALVRNGKPGTSKPFPVDPRSVRLAHDLCRGMELFIVAHEFGHVYAGHLDTANSKLHMSEVLTEISSSHRKEYEADYAALIFTTHSLEHEQWDFWQINSSIKLFFSSLDLINRYADYITNGPNRKFTSKESETHPSNENRKKSIDFAIGELEIPTVQRDLASHHGILIDEATHLLWASITKDKSAPGRNDPCYCGSGLKYKKCCSV
ncbi:SEC-C metal-binding domain-containing protein [Pseudomonas sp. NPDC088429]|uniref:SEC-C metal-binding domain-containing protein n=1 Tax=Pseudomonas sp. NPDC088429 TaxID=3364455 RepID=UPI00382F67F1